MWVCGWHLSVPSIPATCRAAVVLVVGIEQLHFRQLPQGSRLADFIGVVRIQQVVPQGCKEFAATSGAAAAEARFAKDLAIAD